jgi:serine/threonine protein kinase
MICPRCSIAELPENGGACPLCGFAASGSVLIEHQVVDEVLEYIQDVLSDHFQIRSIIGLGTRSFVYLARDVARNRLVALKVIPAAAVRDAALVQRFERQAALYGSLQHAQIVPLIAYGVARSFLWYTMEPARGKPLATILRESRPMEADACLRIVSQVAGALEYAHRRGVIHGSLKPTSIFVDDDWVSVSDFAMGEVSRAGSGLKTGAAAPMEPEYLAPEHLLRRGVSPATDQYALGILAYRCLTGTLPFVGDSDDEVTRQHASEAPPSLATLRPELPPNMPAAVERALAKDPKQRFPSIVQFAASLAGRPTPPSVAAPPAPTRNSLPSRLLTIEPDPEDELALPPAPRRWPWVVALGLVLVGGAGGTLLWQRQHEQQVPRPILPTDFVRDSSLMAVRQDTVKPPPPQFRPFVPSVAVPHTAGSPAGTAPAAASPAPAALTAGELAHLFVNAEPWGQVYVDDQLIGNTPRADVPMMPGTHRVRVVHEGFRPFEQVVHVKPGETVRLTSIVLEPQQQ